MDDSQDETSSSPGVGRRRFLKRTAAVSAVAFTAPAIMTIKPAGAAELTSPPPEPPEPPSASVGGKTASRGGAANDPSGANRGAGRARVAGATAQRDELAATGIETNDLLVAGLAATAGGGALLLWSADTGTRTGSSAEFLQRITGTRPPPI